MGFQRDKPGIEVVEQDQDRWGWRYVDHGRGQVLTGNDTFYSEEEAVHSASAAYPDIDNISIHAQRAPAGPADLEVNTRAEARRLGLVLGAALVGALVLRALRRRSS
ncbi:MAG TPA: hypothetical protein VFF07_07080 [Actinomycetota bacterium]|nr:hypothetical protein [Actinomycetota bacterium]